VFPSSSFSVPATIDEQQNEVQPPHTTSNSNSNRRGDEVMPTAEDFANLFFASSEDDDDSTSSTTSSSIQSLTMNHHQWEPEPHWQQNTTITSGGTTATAAATFTTPHHNNHKRRRVSFTTDTPTIHSLTSVPPASTMTPHEKATIWLQSTDIEVLKSSAQSTIQNMRQRVLQQKNPRQFISQQQDCRQEQQQHRHTQFRKLMLSLEHETNSSIRGLEHKIYRRKHNRQVLIADVIECQHHINGLAKFGFVMDVDEQRRLLANASLKKSLGCVKRALADAIDDYKEVYPAAAAADCSSSSSSLSSPFPLEPLSSSISKIRRVSSGACSSR
jgi:hypothetical protein